MTLIHATCIDIDGKGVVIRGQSGAGKSDLALRLIDRGAKLVSDDQVRLTVEGRELWASPPETIAGRMEVRGVGIIDVPYCERSPVRLVLDLVETDAVPRLPELETVELVPGMSRPIWVLNGREASAPMKAILLLNALESRKADAEKPLG